MAFLPGSRYARVRTVVTRTASGREVVAVALRSLGQPASVDHAVDARDRLDLLAQRRYADGTRFWYIADANTELDARELTRPVGRRIRLPEKP